MYYLLLGAMRSIFRHKKKIMYLRYRAKLDVLFTSNHSKTFITTYTYKINIGIFKISIIYYLIFFYAFTARDMILK